MQKDKIDMFMMVNAEKFSPMTIPAIKERLEKMDDDGMYMLQSGAFRNPTVILVIAIFLGWDRFFLDDIGLGILKVLTCYGLGVWWLVDLFTVTQRTHNYNYRKFLQLASFA